MAETAQRDYYDVLGISKDANEKAIKDTFRKLAMEYHPDRNKSPDAEAKFKEIAEAYAVLSDPKKRTEYDTRGYVDLSGFSTEDLFGGINFDDLFGGLGFDFGLGGGLFDPFRRRHSGPIHGANIEVELHVPLYRVVTGGEETVRFSRIKSCTVCNGSGAEPGHPPKQCKKCDGTGKKVRSSEKGNIKFQQITTCAKCHGRGVIIDKPCHECKGSGNVEHTDSLKVTIPIGVEEGMALRIPSHGQASVDAKGAPGDLFVIVRTQYDPRFERHGANLCHSEDITVIDAVLGTKLKVPTLDGNIEVTVPPGTQPDTVLKVRDKGLPEFNSHEHGDLHIHVYVHIPEKLTSKERDLYQQLQAMDKTK